MKYTIKNAWINLFIQKDITIKSFFDSYYINISKINHLTNLKKVMINNEIIKHTNHLLKQGDILSLKCINDSLVDYNVNQTPIKVLYEDDFILVVDKPCSIIIHEDDKNKTNNLNSCVAYYYQLNGINSSVRPIHRLDKETCGCIIYCKCELFQSYYDYQIENKLIKRDYLALVKNKFINDKQTINVKLKKDRHIKNKMVISNKGDTAITYFEVLNYNEYKNYSLLKCSLQTGKTHQIRVTLSYLNYPIINDCIYNNSVVNDQMMLCAYMIKFNNIFSEKTTMIQSNYKQMFYDYVDYKGE